MATSNVGGLKGLETFKAACKRFTDHYSVIELLARTVVNCYKVKFTNFRFNRKWFDIIRQIEMRNMENFSLKFSIIGIPSW